MNERKCAIIGCGYVGATSAYAIMRSGLFSEMVLIDIDKAKAEGEAEDLAHGLPFNAPMDIYAGDYPDLADASVIILTAGAGQKPGQSRMELAGTNARIFDSIVSGIVKYNRDAILLVVTNPVDVLTYTALVASGFPRERVIGSGTVLDTARLKYLIGKEMRVDLRNVHAFILGEHGDSEFPEDERVYVSQILGEHGDSEFPVFSSANISGIDLSHFCGASDRDVASCSTDSLSPLFEDARDSAYRIIRGKGATYYAIAEAVLRIVSAIARDEKAVLPVSAYVEDYYGVSDICISVPCVIGKGGIESILRIPLDNFEQEKFTRSAAILREAIDSVSVRQ